jgi:hypothetical protein
MIDLTIIGSEKDLKCVIVSSGYILKIYRSEGFRLRAGLVVNASCDLINPGRFPVVIVDLMFSEEEAVNSTGVDIHLLDGLSLEDILINFVLDPAATTILKTIQFSLPDQMATLS